MSKFPITEAEFKPFKRLEKQSSNKGILYAKVEVQKGVFLQVFTAHASNAPQRKGLEVLVESLDYVLEN